MDLRHLLNFVILTSMVLSPTNSQNVDATNLEPSYFFYQRTEYPRDCEDVMNQCSKFNSSGVFTIKPDGYDEPFEVFCQNKINGGGWTLIHRRMDGFINFNRTWSDYKEGFGFINSEFWIGNEKLSILTNQRKYQLRIDIENAAGESFYVTYDSFRITDEFSHFQLVDVGQYDGTLEFEDCPTNTVFKRCSCQKSCANPDLCLDTCNTVEDNLCICQEGFYVNGDECVPPEECGCYITGTGIIPDGGIHVTDDCTERCVCEAGTLTCDSSFRCDSNANCEVQNEIRGCYCRQGFRGDGLSCTRSEFTDCLHVYTSGFNDSGVYNIKPTGWPGSEFEVFCDMSHGGGWTVFQRRKDGSVDFYRTWNDYKNGFPDTAAGELWLGNEKLYYLTNQGNYKMRIDLVNRDGVSYNLNYDEFRIGNEGSNYELETLGGFTGDTGYDYMAYHRGRPFTTHDDDNDAYSYNCAAWNYCRGGWWYGFCYNANLNGHYSSTNYQGVTLYNRDTNTYTEYSLRFTEMKVRPI